MPEGRLAGQVVQASPQALGVELLVDAVTYIGGVCECRPGGLGGVQRVLVTEGCRRDAFLGCLQRFAVTPSSL